MKDTEKIIQELREKKYSCSRATLQGIADSYGDGMPSEEAIKAIASGLRGGIGRTFDEGTCGALTGAVIGLGLIFNKDENAAAENSKRLYHEFKDHFGTVCCGAITNEHGKKRCNECCRLAGRIVEEIVNGK